MSKLFIGRQLWTPYFVPRLVVLSFFVVCNRCLHGFKKNFTKYHQRLLLIGVLVNMLGKRLSYSAKGRSTTKSQDGGKPLSPGLPLHSKPMKMSSGIGQFKFRDAVIPFIRTQENITALPKYTMIATRPPDQLIGMEELDNLQSELENLLCTSALRIRQFQNDLEFVEVYESKKERKVKAAGKQLQYPGKRKYLDEKMMKSKDFAKISSHNKLQKLKTSSSAPNFSSGALSHEGFQTDGSAKLETSALIAPKNNIPIKYWTTLEPWCGPISQDDIKLLESMLATSSNTSLPPIPPLGRHYSEIWADENITDDQNASNPCKQKSNVVSPDAAALRKKIEKVSENFVVGPMTQRLSSILIEDNDLKLDLEKPKGPLGMKLSVKNSLCLEKYVRKQLVEQGILDEDDLAPFTDPEDDEILAEIKRVQAELALFRKENTKSLKNLMGQSKQEIMRLNLKKQLGQMDQECLETYQKIAIAKQKKRLLTKKEKDDAWRSIKDQLKLTNDICSLPLTVKSESYPQVKSEIDSQSADIPMEQDFPADVSFEQARSLRQT